MADGAATSEEGMARFPPGVAPPTASDREAEYARKEAERIAKLKDPAHLEKLNAGRQAWLKLPKEERDRQTAERKARKAAHAAALEAKRLAKNPAPPPPPSVDDAGPPTVRSARSSLQAAPDSDPVRPGARVLRGLLDLVAEMTELGTGSCFIQVSRIKPLTAFNVPCAGIQQAIWEPIDDGEFVTFYGGGEYSLRGYMNRADGSRPKAITEPVPYRVAGHPNVHAALLEEEPMRPNPGPSPNNGQRFGGRAPVLTPQAATAEADMHARELEHQELMDERAATREEDRRRRREANETQRGRESVDMVKILAEAKEKEADRLREAFERQLDDAKNKSNGLTEVAELIKALKPAGDEQGLGRQHAQEVKQLAETHKAEMLRLTDQHKEELVRLHGAHESALRRVEDVARSERDRGDKLIRETEQRAADLIRAAEQRSDQRVADAKSAADMAYNDLKARGEERVRDQDAQWQRRFDDLKEAGARELRGKDSEIALMRSNMEGNTQVILNQKDAEIKRLTHDLRDARDLAEKNKDWVGKMSEFEKTAEKMGFSKGSDEPAGEESVQTTLIKGAMGAVQRLPEMISAGADAISKIRNPGVPPELARAQARAASSGRPIPRALGHAPPVLLQPLSFATEDGGYTPPADMQAPPPQPLPARRPQIPPETPAIAPLEQSPVQSIIAIQPAAPPQQQLPFPQAEATPPQQALSPVEQAPPPPFPSGPHVPPQAAPSVPPAALAASAEQLDPMTAGLIAQFLPALAVSFLSKELPDQVAAQIIQANGVAQARAAMEMASIDLVLVAVQQDQTPGNGSLKTRNGQKFLRDCWAAVERQLDQPAAPA